MIKGTFIIDEKKTMIILQGSKLMEEELFKDLDGAKVSLIGKDFRIGEKTVPFGLLIETVDKNETK
jgi:hypothetical protein